MGYKGLTTHWLWHLAMEANKKLLMVDYENIQRWIANTSQTRYLELMRRDK